MEYRNRKPVTKSSRRRRSVSSRAAQKAGEERNRRRSVGGGQPDELGVTQGQNGEQGNTTEPQNATNIGRSSH